MMKLKKKEKYQPIPGLISEAIDYNVYDPKLRERIAWILIGGVVSGLVLYIFYENIVVSLIVGIACGIAFVPIRTKQVIEKRRKKLTMQFRGLLDALSTSIGAGKNIYDSFMGASSDLAIQFTKDAYIVQETNLICVGLNNNIQIEDLLMNFAERSNVEDIRNFANVFATCYKKGGNIKEVIKNTASVICDKIEIQMELETMVAGQKNEQNIMLVMPVVFVVVLKSMGGDLVDLQSATGILSVTVALAIFVASYFVSKKILDIKI
jgi:tight adherence protein B